jgi:replicative DNA helicase
MNDSTNNDDTPGGEPAASADPLGGVDAVLRDTDRAIVEQGSTRQLHVRLSRDAASMRHPQASRFASEPLDAVLRLSVARKVGTPVSEELRTEAVACYVREPEDYESVLGAFIPEDFRQQCRVRLAQQAYQQNTNTTAAEDWSVFEEMRSSMGQGGLLGPSTGLPKLDEKLGGLSGLIFLGADKGVGKTSLALYMAYAALRQNADLAVLIYSLDMPKTRIYQRLLCCATGLSHHVLFAKGQASEQERARAAEAETRLRQDILPRLRVVERDFSYESRDCYNQDALPVRKGLTYEGIVSDCNRLIESSGASNVLIVVDLFQKMDPRGEVADSAAKDHFRLDTLDQVRQESCCAEWPCGFPILVTSEIRKDVSKENLSRDDLKGDGRIASDADVVMLMWPEKGANGDVIPTTLRIDKGREGVTRGDLTLWFQHACCRFYDAAPAGTSEQPANRPPAPRHAHAKINPLAE